MRRPLLTTLLAISVSILPALGQSGDFAQPVTPLTRALKAGVGDILDATRNKEFLSKPLSAEQVEALRAHLGRDVAERALGAGELTGRTVKELMSSRPEIASQFPQVISYLAATQRTQGVRLYGNDRDPAPLDIAAPGRVIPNDDLSRISSGGSAGEKFGEYLKTNFSMDEAQMRSYTAFLDLAGGRAPAALGTKKTDIGPLQESLATAARGMPSGGKGGLYMPGGEVLGHITQLIAYLDAYREEPGADASRFRGPDGRTLGDLVAEFDPDSGKQRSVDQLRRLSETEVQSLIGELMSKVVKTDLEGSNRFLFEMGLAWVKPPEDKAAASSGGGRGKRAPEGAVLGNGKVRSMNEELYRKLILEKHTGPERDKIELESDGEFFAVRGRPADITQKHYDPPIDGENMFYGAGMNLDNQPKSHSP